jgi:hypothetical protein
MCNKSWEDETLAVSENACIRKRGVQARYKLSMVELVEELGGLVCKLDLLQERIPLSCLRQHLLDEDSHVPVDL